MWGFHREGYDGSTDLEDINIISRGDIEYDASQI